VIRIYHRCNEKKKCEIGRHHNGDQKIAKELSEEPIVKFKRRERDNQKTLVVSSYYTCGIS
jgi:hypothetical protein